MGAFKSFLVWTNPITLAFAIPVGVGVAVGAAIKGAIVHTAGFIKDMHEEVKDE